MEIYLHSRSNDDLLAAWKTYCGQYSFVIPTTQSLLDIKAEAFVAPGNSFGCMTGGLDLYYKNYLGFYVEGYLKRTIMSEYNNELLVGQAVSIPLDSDGRYTAEYLIYAPTMRVPENVSHTINAYLAAKAALITAIKYNMESVVIPGLGTGTGGMLPKDCARQVCAAIEDVLINKRAYRLINEIYSEQQHMINKIVSTKWLEVQLIKND